MSYQYRRPFKAPSRSGFVIGAGAIGLAVAVGIGVYPAALVESREQVTITVEEKERVSDGEDSRYLVFTDKGTFEVTDSLLAMRFDSSDVYGKLKVGQTFEVTRQGWRQPLLSSYPNIIEVRRVEAGASLS